MKCFKLLIPLFLTFNLSACNNSNVLSTVENNIPQQTKISSNLNLSSFQRNYVASMIQRLFELRILDTDMDGVIRKHDLLNMTGKFFINETIPIDIFEKIDLDHDNLITQNELKKNSEIFLSLIDPMNPFNDFIPEYVINLNHKIFISQDKNRDGSLNEQEFSVEEYNDVQPLEMTKFPISIIFNLLDENINDQITSGEFTARGLSLNLFKEFDLDKNNRLERSNFIGSLKNSSIFKGISDNKYYDVINQFTFQILDKNKNKLLSPQEFEYLGYSMVSGMRKKISEEPEKPNNTNDDNDGNLNPPNNPDIKPDPILSGP